MVTSRSFVRGLPMLLFVALVGAPHLVAQRPGGGPVPNAAGNQLTVSTATTVEPTRAPNTGPFSVPFTVKNTGTTTIGSISLTCERGGPVTCGTVTPSFRSSLVGGASFSVTVTYSVGAPGTGFVGMRATYGGDINPLSSYKERTVVVGSLGPPTVTLRNHNRDNVDRSLCLTAGAGEAAAWSCGDLVVTHAMPGFTTMGRERTLTLIHNSATAYPRPAIAAVVTEPTTTSLPPTVYAEIRVGAGAPSPQTSATYTTAGWANGPAGARQLVLDFNGALFATGAYPIQLRVRNQYPGVYETVVDDTLLIVNRFFSEFGAGFSLAGLEQLYLHQPVGTNLEHILWVGGDGSAKLYRKAGPTTWVAAAGAYRDTLTLSGGVYTRKLRHGVQVTFGSSGRAEGRHIETINRVGVKTVFGWDTSTAVTRLTSITVPPAGQTGTTYALRWDGLDNLDSIIDPATRALDVTITNGRMSRLTDPDGRHVDFGSDGDRRILWRNNRRGYTTSYEYSNGLAYGSRVTKVTIPTERPGLVGTTAVTRFEPWNDKGLAVGSTNQIAADTAKAFTRFLGPRSLAVAGDTVVFWVDRWGAPTRIGTPVPATTTITRGNATFPAQVTEVRYPNGRVVTMRYDTLRGNLTQVRDSTKHLDQRPTKAQTYVYPTTGLVLDSPTQVDDSLNGQARTTSYHYNNAGLTDTVIAPNGHRMSLAYKTGALAGVVDSTMERKVETWKEGGADDVTDDGMFDQVHRFTYDTKGNVKTYTSPVGVVTSYLTDAKGRITDVYDPLKTREERQYDDLNRVLEIRRYTNPVAHPGGVDPLGAHNAQGRPCDATQVLCVDSTVAFNPTLPANPQMTRYGYDENGAMVSVTDPRNLRRTFGYDARGLRWQSTDDFGVSDVTYLSGVGASDSTLSRRGIKVRTYYDPSGRRTALAYPAVPSPDPTFAPATTLGDSIRYEYDVMGNVTKVRNNTDSIVREYYADGALKRKISSVGPKVGSTPYRADTISYVYDASGAVTKVTHGRDVTDYVYHPTTGDLQTMTVTWGGRSDGARVFSFLWDALGRRRQITYPTDPTGPSDMTVKYRYDAAGVLRRVVSSHPGAPGGVAAADVFDFTFRNKIVDAAGRVWRQELTCLGVSSPGNPCGGSSGGNNTRNQYNRFGMLMRQEAMPSGATARAESMQYDGSGNMILREKWDPDLAALRRDVFLIDSTAAATHNQLKDVSEANARLIPLNILYLPDGARKWEKAYDNHLDYRETYYYYDGLGRMAGSVERDDDQLNTLHHNPGSCVYDPEGQLALPCSGAGATYLAFNGANVSGVLYTPTVTYPDAGWSFVHGPGTDDPLTGYHRQLGTERIFYFVTDGQGRVLAVADSSGERKPTDVSSTPIARWSLAGGISAGHSFNADRQSGGDVPELSFFRNRAYDMTTGRFTQEDPIGVAGGLNLYQYAGNNPVMFTDPFGLCPDNDADCELIVSSFQSAGEVGGFLFGGGTGIGETVLSGGVLAPVAVAQTVTAVAVGGAAGRALGELVSQALHFGDKARPKDGSEQRDEIQKAQDTNRKRGQGDKINRIGKSKQRGKQSDKQKAQDALDGIDEE